MSSPRRPIVLMGILLVLLLAYLVQAQLYPQLLAGYSDPPALAPLAGTNSVSHLDVKQNAKGMWTADFDYFYTGEPRVCFLQIELLPRSVAPDGAAAAPGHSRFVSTPQRGAHHVSVPLDYPGSEQTTRVGVTLRDPMRHSAVIATQQTDKVIEWPNWYTWSQNLRMAQSTPAENLQRAVALIDLEAEPQLIEAKAILERLINQNPRFDAAYVELARVAMRSNWGPEGLHQAETLLSSALLIQPDSVNARILLGYVYTHQNRFTPAQELFTGAARSNPPNLWLWANWGELLLMQHKYDEAIAKYREAIARPMTHDTYDRARKEAYRHLLQLLGQRKDLDGMEALYKQQVAEFGPGSCYTSDYARFKLQVRGDTQGAIDLARGALNKDCEDSAAREVLGLAQYVKWAATAGPERTESLNQARIYLPAGPMPLYLLAASERTSPAIKQLLAAGESIDQRDNEKKTALAYAFQNGDLGAAKRLLALRARPDTPVGYEEIPLALVPVMERNIEAIRLLREYGVDYSKLRYRGATAFDFAKQSGDNALLKALGRSETVL
jgi:tetratricopeptide (TPR) repeat protein